MTSPSSISERDISFTIERTSSGTPPIWAGQKSATAINSPSVLASAQVKSSASEKTVE